jgi:hypothetical protein
VYILVYSCWGKNCYVSIWELTCLYIYINRYMSINKVL